MQYIPIIPEKTSEISPLNLVNILSAYFCEFLGYIIVTQTTQINADYPTVFLQDCDETQYQGAGRLIRVFQL